MVIHREWDDVEKLMEPFYGKTYDWFQDAGERNWGMMTLKDWTGTYSAKKSELDLEAMSDFKTYSVLFDGQWYSRWLWPGYDNRPVKEWVKEIWEWKEEVKKNIVPNIKEDDVITILDYHN